MKTQNPNTGVAITLVDEIEARCTKIQGIAELIGDACSDDMRTYGGAYAITGFAQEIRELLNGFLPPSAQP